MKYVLLMLNVLGLILISGCEDRASLHNGQLNLLIMGEDANTASVRRDSSAFQRVLNSLSNQMHDAGYNVYDETTVSLDNFAQGRVRRSDAELIDIARSVKHPPIDVAVLFAIYPTAIDKGYTTKVNARVEGRMLNAQNGQRLGNFELDFPGAWNAPPDCSRRCLENTVGEHAAIIANDIGAALAQKLGGLTGGSTTREPNYDNREIRPLATGYSLVFEDFTADEVHRMESFMEFFSGYQSHRVVYAGMNRTEYWYSSTIGSAKLLRNLNKLLDRMNLKGTVHSTGSDFTITKVGAREKKRVIDPSEW